MHSKPTVGDKAHDFFEKFTGPVQRAGITDERAFVMLRVKNVAPEAIAAQMTANSAKNHTYSAQGVIEKANSYEDSMTRVLITAKQARGLSELASDDFDLIPA